VCSEVRLQYVATSEQVPKCTLGLLIEDGLCKIIVHVTFLLALHGDMAVLLGAYHEEVK
jgi:hypothetical protein